jgi:hypothetical protein
MAAVRRSIARNTAIMSAPSRPAPREGLVASTDQDWYSFLLVRPGIDEVNFWRPSGEALVLDPSTAGGRSGDVMRIFEVAPSSCAGPRPSDRSLRRRARCTGRAYCRRV